MIAAMKKVELLLYHREREMFLDELAQLGVLHINEKVAVDLPGASALTAQILALSRSLAQVKKTFPASLPSAAASDLGPAAWAEQIQEIFRRLEAISGEKSLCQKETGQLTIWGDFSWQKVQELSKHDLHFYFCEVPSKYRSQLQNYPHTIISEMGAKIYTVIILRASDQQPDWIWENLTLPARSLSEIQHNLQQLQQEEVLLNTQLQGLAGQQAAMSTHLAHLQEELQMSNAQGSMELLHSSLLYLEAFVPVQESQRLTQRLDQFACWYQLQDPSSNDQVPVLLKNRPVAKVFEPITKIFALPDYFELDPTAFFAPFYALFFGLCLADIGYGVILMLIAGVGAIKLPAMRPVMFLGMILGLMTFLCGILLNSFFGAAVYSDPQGTMALLSEIKFDNRTIYPAMALAVYLGVVQILLAMLLKAVNGVRNGTWEHGVYPIGTMLLTLAVTGGLIKINFLEMTVFFEIVSNGAISAAAMMNWELWPQILGSLIAVGLVLLFFFNNPEKKLAVRLPLGLWSLYQFLTGIMGDGLSYIRLFALGLAGGLLGNAFNKIALDLVAEGQPRWMWIFTIIVFVLGHTINFALAVLGSFVHPLRLTFVEFYNNLGFKGGGARYRPLIKTKTTNIKGV